MKSRFGKITVAAVVLLMAAVLVSNVFAANEVKGIQATGLYMYYRIFREADNYQYNHTTSAYAATVSDANSVCPMTEKAGTGYYYDDFPGGPAGRYLCVGYTGTQGLEAPSTDACLGSTTIDWSGTAEITLASLTADIAALEQKVADANDVLVGLLAVLQATADDIPTNAELAAAIAADPNLVALYEAVVTGADRLSVLHTLLLDLPTVAEFNLRTLPAANYQQKKPKVTY